jgi:hypothetical protein
VAAPREDMVVRYSVKKLRSCSLGVPAGGPGGASLARPLAMPTTAGPQIDRLERPMSSGKSVARDWSTLHPPASNKISSTRRLALLFAQA